MSKYVLVCFDDGDACVYNYNSDTDTILDCPGNWVERATSKTFSDNKESLLQMAALAWTGKWIGQPKEAVDITDHD